ncbi:MAG: DUF1211 domain-containing protein [Chloroflexi bacterium]|nr:MAG: DUF1211 domain-containing protein [Chloroflexota bacterium]
MPAEARDRRVFGLERLVFFSDAVFAIAITLLVIDLRLPDLGDHVSNQQLSAALGALVPRIFAYALSFWVIGLYWLAHWRRYQYIERVDETLIALNLLLLGLVAFMPFPTALIGEFGDRPGIVVLYAGILSAAGAVGPVTWLYALRRGLVARDLPEAYARLTVIRAFSVPAIMLGSLLLLPVVSPQWVESSWFLIVPVQFIVARRYGTG